MNFGLIEMEVDFDKQIDTILRDLAKGNSLAESPPVSHLDADELSAFAENVLPQKARLRAMEHLADCQRCRKTLSTFVSLGDAVESEIISEEVKAIAAIPEIHWYRKMFAFPALSYAMGAMALLLVGMVGFLVLQNSRDTANSVAKNEPVAEKVKGPSGISSDGDAPISEVYPANAAANTSAPASNMPTSAANYAVSSNSTISAANTAPKTLATPSAVGSSNSSATTSDKDGLARDVKEKEAKDDAVASKSGEGKAPENELAATPAPSVVQSRNEDNLATRQQVVEQNATRNQAMTPDGGGEAKRSMPSAAPAPKKAAPREEAGMADEAVKNKSLSKPTVFKDVAGKSFSKVDGVWTDTSYKGGNTNTVKRGSEDYKKLDSGLRSTADYLGGTVIIVWKGKNYKIQ